MIMFAVFSFLTILRYTIYPRIFLVMIRHETHSLFLGCIPMGFVTIVSGICLTGHEYGLDTLDTGLVLWWIALGQFSLLQCSSPRLFVAVLTALDLSNAVMSLLTSFGVPCVIFSAHRVQAETFTAAWLLPMVPPSTVAAVGTSICKLLLLQHRYSYAFVVLITSYVILGVALCTAIGIMVSLPLSLEHSICLPTNVYLLSQVLYLQRLLLYQLPPREVIVSALLPVGAVGQGGYALLEAVSRPLSPHNALSTLIYRV